MEFEGLRLNVARSDLISNRLDYGEILGRCWPKRFRKKPAIVSWRA